MSGWAFQTSMDEHMFVSQKLVQDKVQYIWLGFSDEVEPDVLLWVDGTPANGSGVFDVWTKSFPYPLPDKVDCGILEVVSNYSCDAGWQLSVTIPDTSIAWIGLKLDRNDMNYYWVDANKEKFTNYLPGEPNNQDEGLDCIAMVSGSLHYPGGWFDQNCSRPLDYICQKPAVSWRPSQDQKGEYVQVNFYQTMLLSSVNVAGELNSFSFVTKYKIQFQYNTHTPWYWIEESPNIAKLLHGVTIMGNPDADEYVTTFQLQFQLNDGKGTYASYQEPYGTPMNFTGNVDNNSSVTYLLKSTVPAQHVRLVPLDYHNHVALRFDLLVCSLALCEDIPLLSGKHNVSDFAFTASSYLDPQHGPHRARLRGQSSGAYGDAWVAKFNDAQQYIQVDIGEAVQVWAVATQGSAELQQWVRSYTLAFSQDGKTFSTYSSNGRDPRQFDGNFDASTVRKHYITIPTVARYVQLWPTDYEDGIALRLEVYGCPAYTESAWIGLNDLQESYFYQWSSGSEVVYTNWDINQPLTSPTMEQHCVAMSNQLVK
nr:hypothetical protein BaRGS_016008 [Batillaria attramentaria]